MSIPPDLTALLATERKRAARKPETAEQRKQRRQVAEFHSSLQHAWRRAYLLSDEELQWIAAVTAAAQAKGTRKYRRWSGLTDLVPRATSPEDAARLDRLSAELSTRYWKRETKLEAAQAVEDRRKVLAALCRLGLPVPEQFQRSGDTDEGGQP